MINKYTTVHNVKPVACNDEVTGTAFLYKKSQLNFYLALYFWCQNIYIHLFVIMICILWLHCIYFLYRHSSTWSSTTYMYTLLLSVKEECCWRYLHGYCTSHPVRMNFENVNGGSSTVSTVQQNSISLRQFKPLQFISEGNQLSMQIAIVYMGNMYKLYNAGVK